MLGYECGHSGDSKSTAGSDNYSRWSDDILYRRLSSADGQCCQLMAVEHGSYHTSNNSNGSRKLFSDGNERKRMFSDERSGSSNGNEFGDGDNHSRRADDVLPGRLSGADS